MIAANASGVVPVGSTPLAYHGQGDRREEQRGSVGLGPFQRLGGDLAGRAGAVLDDHGVTDGAGYGLHAHARCEIARAAGLHRDEDSHRLREGRLRYRRFMTPCGRGCG